MIKINMQGKKNHIEFIRIFKFFGGVLLLILPVLTEAFASQNSYIYQGNMKNHTDEESDSFFSQNRVQFRPFGDYNMTRNTQQEGFKSYLKGTGFDVATQITDSFSAGIGYAYSTTDLKRQELKNRIDGNSVMVFGKYQPEKWYVGGRFIFNQSKYKDKQPQSVHTHTNIYRGELLSGYEMGNVHNYSGLKYTYLQANDKENAPDAALRKNGEVVSAVIGTEYRRIYHPAQDVSLTPHFWLSGNYDFKSNSGQTVIDVPDSAFIYAFEGRRLHRLGLETGTRLGIAYKQAELSLGYGLNWRVSHTSQTGKIGLNFRF